MVTDRRRQTGGGRRVHASSPSVPVPATVALSINNSSLEYGPANWFTVAGKKGPMGGGGIKK